MTTAKPKRRSRAAPKVRLTLGWTWAGYAKWRADDRSFTAFCKAMKHEADTVTVELERGAVTSLITACDQGGRPRTAEQIRLALKAAEARETGDDSAERGALIEQLAAEGEMTPAELAAWERIRGTK